MHGADDGARQAEEEQGQGGQLVQTLLARTHSCCHSHQDGGAQVEVRFRVRIISDEVIHCQHYYI